MKKVAVIMGSDSDLPIVEKAIDTLKSFDVPTEVHVYSAHRTPVECAEFTRAARDNGFGVIIAAAGMAAHLAGAIAANTTLPVIGIPCKGPNFDGMDALLLACQILAVEDKELQEKLDNDRKSSADTVLQKDRTVSGKYSS